ncbi:MAG: universal stress protein [Trebonia sp.]|jgi:nucleotide-binding universal stress UspA family protein
MTTKPIVVGTDGSEQSVRAVEWAAREAVLRGAPLRIVSAAEILPRMSEAAQPAGVETVATHLIGERDHALAGAARAAAAVAPDLLIDTDPVDGPPAQAVTASGSGALLLVVGSHGGGAFAAMTLGSVSRYAAVHAPCPVVVVREEAPAADRLVAVGIRSPLDCGAALAFAFEEARLRKAAVLAVHAWQFPDSHAADRDAVELDELLDDCRVKYPDVEASGDVVRGHPGRVLADLSARAELVVLGRHHANDRLVPGPARVIHAVVGHAHGPVVTVPSQGA